MVCGGYTPTELLQAHEAGCELVKLFPARAGGPEYVKDILAPLPFLKIVPTGGVSAENARDYLAAGAVAVGIDGYVTMQVASTLAENGAKLVPDVAVTPSSAPAPIAVRSTSSARTP